MNLPPDAYASIEAQATAKGITMTEYLRKAAELFRLVDEPGTDVQITRGDKTMKVMFL